MGKFIINGGNRLEGSINIESAKNSVLPILAASILTSEKVVILNCPKIKDVLSMIDILVSLGVKVYFDKDSLIVDSSNINAFTISERLTHLMRSSIFMMGALLSRLKKASICYPGGCQIGARPIDIHISGLRALGVNVEVTECGINCNADEICGGKITLEYPSVGATENLILASVFCKDTVVINNCAREPEIIDLVNFLNSMGAKIYGAGSYSILIQGVKALFGTEFKPMPDRIETATFFTALLMNGGIMEIFNCNVKNILYLCDKFNNNTCKIYAKNDIINIICGKSRNVVDITTAPYPGFPTDIQPQTMAYATIADGTSIINETVFENRFIHVSELKKMGANITIKDSQAIVKGVKRLKGATVRATDLRGGAALVLAGLCAEGVSVINDICHIERGYLNLDNKLSALGVDIVRIE